MEYLYTKLYGDKGLKDNNGELVDCTECMDVYCNGKVREEGEGEWKRGNRYEETET